MANFFDQFDSAGPSMSPTARDLAIRTVYGEAGAEPDEGKAAVASVIRNRAQSGRYGKDVVGVITAPNQFEPWQRPDARQRMMALRPDSPEYQAIGQIVDGVFSGQSADPTKGATHFFSPSAQAALGRKPPKWAQGEGQAIGRHTFYAPEGRATDFSAAKRQGGNFFDQFDGQAAEAALEPATVEQQQTPEEVARAKLAAGLRAGKNNDAEIYRTAAFRTNQGVPKAGATDAAINGATLGFGDEVSAAARAPIDMARRGESFDEAYQHNLAAERDRLNQYRQESPVASKVAEVVGGVIVPAGRAGAIRTGAAIGAASGAGNSEGDANQRAADAGIGGVVGGALGGVVSGAVRAIGGRAPSAAPTIQELKAAAKQGYNSEAVTGLEMAPTAVRDAATRIRASLDESGFDDVVASKAHNILKKLETIPDDAVTVTGRNLHTLQKTLGKAAGSADPSERAAASIALREVNQFLENVPANAVTRGSVDDFSRAMKDANANYSAAMSAGRVDQKLVQAEIRAAAANSGMNVSNTIRQRMADIVANPKLQRGLTDDEVAAARQIAEGTTGQNLLRKAGNMMGGGGGIGAALTGGGGFAIAGPAGAAVPVVGMVLKSIGNKMTVNQAQKLSDMIRTRAPLASATQKFEERVIQFQEARNAKTAAAAAIAARNLANNLRGSGFNISAGDLMRALTGPAAGRAENDQPEIPRPGGQ